MVPRNPRHAFRVTSETVRFLNGYTQWLHQASLEAALVEFATFRSYGLRFTEMARPRNLPRANAQFGATGHLSHFGFELLQSCCP